jgi:hypothetical protein
MAKRKLSDDFLKGLSIANGYFCRAEESFGRDGNALIQMPIEFADMFFAMPTELQRGVIEYLCAYVRCSIECGRPRLGVWNPREELEDYTVIYGSEENGDA